MPIVTPSQLFFQSQISPLELNINTMKFSLSFIAVVLAAGCFAPVSPHITCQLTLTTVASMIFRDMQLRLRATPCRFMQTLISGGFGNF
jgi:hypothetical protein